MAAEKEGEIPQPPPRLLVGNLYDIDPTEGAISLRNLTKLYGPIFFTDMMGTRVVHLSSQELVNKISDEKRFEKLVGGSLKEVRNLTGSGRCIDLHASPANVSLIAA